MGSARWWVVAFWVTCSLAGCRQQPSVTIRFESPDAAAARARATAGSAVDAAIAPLVAPLVAPPVAPPVGLSGECTSDGDCAVAAADCCGCNAGGKARAVARGEQAAWEASLRARCGETMCAQAMSEDPSCGRTAVCRARRCVLDEKPSRR